MAEYLPVYTPSVSSLYPMSSAIGGVAGVSPAVGVAAYVGIVIKVQTGIFMTMPT